MYRKIANNYGSYHQENLLIEEMSELTKAICKKKRFEMTLDDCYALEEIKNNIIEEIADVRLLLKQLVYLYDCENEVEKIEELKIKRTMELMKK